MKVVEEKQAIIRVPDFKKNEMREVKEGKDLCLLFSTTEKPGSATEPRTFLVHCETPQDSEIFLAFAAWYCNGHLKTDADLFVKIAELEIPA